MPRPRGSSAQEQSVPGVPSPRVSLECPAPESPWNAQPHSVPECPALYQKRVGMFEVNNFFLGGGGGEGGGLQKAVSTEPPEATLLLP